MAAKNGRGLNDDVKVLSTLSMDREENDIFETGTDEITGLDRYTAANWIYPINYPVRNYQRNIVGKALFTNTLVTLPTGLGKTFIAAVVMYNFHRWFPGHKVVFMAHSRPLVSQQVEACAQIMGMPSDSLAHLNGSISVASRKIQWETKRIFFLTPQVFNNDLTSGLVAPESIRCIVVDEAHKALGNQAFCQVVRSLHPFNSIFRVLALSATPGNDVSTMKKVIENLMISHLEIRTEEDEDIKQYLHIKNVQDIVVSLDSKIVDYKNQLLKVSEKYLKQLTSAKAIPASYGSLSSFALVLKQKQFIAKSTVPGDQRGLVLSNFSVVISLYKAIEELIVHGLRSLHNKLIAMKSGDGSKSNTHHRLAKDTDLLALLESLEGYIGQDKDIAFNPDVSMARLQDELDAQASGAPAPKVYSHPKFVILEDIVTQHFYEWKEKNESTRVIIFCKSRPCTGEICNFLNRFRPLIKPMVLIGQSQSKSGSESTSRGLKQSAQLEVMRKFRGGDYNTLVATCVGEEGLDVGEVDLIVNFDATRNSNTQVQRCGRTGRKRDGKIVNLLTEGKEQQDYKASLSKSSSMNKRLSHGIKDLPLAPRRRLIPDEIQPYYQEMYLGLTASTSGAKTRPVVDIEDEFNAKGSSSGSLSSSIKKKLVNDIMKGESAPGSSSSSGSLNKIREKQVKPKKRMIKTVKNSQPFPATQSKYDIRYAMDKAREKSKKTVPQESSQFHNSSFSSSQQPNTNKSPSSDAIPPAVICLDDSFEEDKTAKRVHSDRELLYNLLHSTNCSEEILDAMNSFSMEELLELVSANEDLVRMPEHLLHCGGRPSHLPVENVPEDDSLGFSSDLEEVPLPPPPDPVDNMQDWALFMNDLEDDCKGSINQNERNVPSSAEVADLPEKSVPTVNKSINSMPSLPMKVKPLATVTPENVNISSCSSLKAENHIRVDHPTFMKKISPSEPPARDVQKDLMTVTQALEVVAAYKWKKDDESFQTSYEKENARDVGCSRSEPEKNFDKIQTKIPECSFSVIPESPEKQVDDKNEEMNEEERITLIPETEDYPGFPNCDNYETERNACEKKVIPVSPDGSEIGGKREVGKEPKSNETCKNPPKFEAINASRGMDCPKKLRKENDDDEIIESSPIVGNKTKKSLFDFVGKRQIYDQPMKPTNIIIGAKIDAPKVCLPEIEDTSPSLVSSGVISRRSSKAKKSLLFEEPVKSPPRFRSLSLDSDDDLFADCEKQRAVLTSERKVNASENSDDLGVLTQRHNHNDSQVLYAAVVPLEKPFSQKALHDLDASATLKDKGVPVENDVNCWSQNRIDASKSPEPEAKRHKKIFVYRPTIASLQHKRHRVAPLQNRPPKSCKTSIDMNILELSPIEKAKKTPVQSKSVCGSSPASTSNLIGGLNSCDQSTPLRRSRLEDDELSDGALEAIMAVEEAALAETNKPPVVNLSSEDELSDDALRAIKAVEEYEKAQIMRSDEFARGNGPTPSRAKTKPSNLSDRREEADFRLWSSDEDDWFQSKLKAPPYSQKKSSSPSISSRDPSTSYSKSTSWISTKRPSLPYKSPQPSRLAAEKLSPLNKPKRSKQRRRKVNPFLDDEAVLSGSGSSDDSNGTDLDDMDSSFLDERLAPTQAPDIDMTAKYLSAIKSPRVVPGAFKIPEAPGNRNINVFSQVVRDDEDYEEDSFCVGDATEVCDESLSELELAEMRLERRGKRRRRGSHTTRESPTTPIVPKRKRRRVILMESSSDEEDANQTIRACSPTVVVAENTGPSSSSGAITPQSLDMVQITGNRLTVASDEKPLVLIGSRAISSTPDIAIDLRAKFQFKVDVRSSPGADYIVGWRVGINRLTLSEWRNGMKTNRDEIDGKTDKLAKLFMKPVIIVEDDKMKSLYKQTGLGQSMHMKHLGKRFDEFSRRGIRIFHTKDKAHTAEIIAKLTLQECSVGCGVVTCFKNFTPELEERLSFYTKLPSVNYALAMRLCQKFSSIKRMMLGCDSIPEIRVNFSASPEDAKRIHRILFRSFCSFKWPNTNGKR